ncbi:2-hydroxy-3-oxopropionate reductase [Rubrobacter tropicus]|uniref:2-hydroxy-3-oxopropionate reductase n=1 Tax=Rubrobacter tropicus TaxID=2653851 RepID=A0A6G8QBP4_9ACTN|nr:2-hydroxy-3-oxopropionate reductase [Rubrobacter tropicus]QIN83910.1 2-hydroxy-3-oxopropionate reductase [Rubrobacter tropicus]
MAEKVGFVGLGIMGKPMARNLIEAGHDLVLYNRTREKAEDLAGDKAIVAASPREVAEQSDVIITMLPDSPQVEEVLTGPDGVLEGVREGALIVDMSTISPVVTKGLAAKAEEKGASMLDAPVSGGDVGAIDGTLSIMVGGSEEDFERAGPLFEAMGKTITHVGGSGTGQVVKAANQIVVALTIEAVSEALVLGSKAGVEPGKILDVLGGGLAGNKVIEAKREKMLGHSFDPGFRIELHHKDLGIALAAGREYGVALPVTAVVDQMLETLKAKGRGDRDHSALLTLIEDSSGHEIGNGGS